MERMMDPHRLLETIRSVRIIPVIVLEDTASAIPLADTLIKGGLPVAEITFRTAAAAEAIALLKKERPDLLLGAGTVLDMEQLRKAHDCGACFAVSPGLNADVVRESVRMGFPFFPGVMTPTEVGNALALGTGTCKFFPAEAAGGLKMLKSLAAPFVHTGVTFIPTGGINASNWKTYLESPLVLAVGGTWIAPREDIRTGNWEAIFERCRETLR